MASLILWNYLKAIYCPFTTLPESCLHLKVLGRHFEKTSFCLIGPGKETPQNRKKKI